jgi:hypothetical protein
MFVALGLYFGTPSPLYLIPVIGLLAAILLNILRIKNYDTFRIVSLTILGIIIISGLILVYTYIFRDVYLKNQIFRVLFYIFTVGLIIYSILFFRELVKNWKKNANAKKISN